MAETVNVDFDARDERTAVRFRPRSEEVSAERAAPPKGPSAPKRTQRGGLPERRPAMKRPARSLLPGLTQRNEHMGESQ